VTIVEEDVAVEVMVVDAEEADTVAVEEDMAEGVGVMVVVVMAEVVMEVMVEDMAEVVEAADIEEAETEDMAVVEMAVMEVEEMEVMVGVEMVDMVVAKGDMEVVIAMEAIKLCINCVDHLQVYANFVNYVHEID